MCLWSHNRFYAIHWFVLSWLKRASLHLRLWWWDHQQRKCEKLSADNCVTSWLPSLDLPPISVDLLWQIVKGVCWFLQPCMNGFQYWRVKDVSACWETSKDKKIKKSETLQHMNYFKKCKWSNSVESNVILLVHHRGSNHKFTYSDYWLDWNEVWST